MEVEVVDHPLIEKAEHVCAGTDQEPLVGERALQRAGSAEALAALEDEHRASRPGQVGGRGQTVVAAADDDRVPVSGRQLRDRGGQADLTELVGDLVHADTLAELGAHAPGSSAPVSASTAAAALRPLRAMTLPAGWVAAPHM